MTVPNITKAPWYTRLARAWRGEVWMDVPPKLYLLGCRFQIVPYKKMPKDVIMIACHPHRVNEINKIFNDGVAAFDPRVKR